MTSEAARVAVFTDLDHPAGAWPQALARWWRRAAEARRARRKRARALAAGVPMRRHLLRDLGMIEADAQRLGLPF